MSVEATQPRVWFVETGGIKVFEAAPVLDLLEPAVRVRLEIAAVHGEQGLLEAHDPAVALLRTHGRLRS